MLAKRVRQGSSSYVVRQFKCPLTPRNLLKVLILLKVLLGLTLIIFVIEELNDQMQEDCLYQVNCHVICSCPEIGLT